MRMRPAVTSKKRGIRLTSVDLAGAAGADEGEHFAGCHFEIDVVQDLVVAFTVAHVGKAHVLEYDVL